MIKLQRELVISIVLFISSTFAALLTFSHIIETTDTTPPLLSAIPSGLHYFRFEHENICVGNVEHSLQSSVDLTELKYSGNLKIKYGETVVQPNFYINATFNSLGQLGGSILKINLADSFLTLGTINIDPLTIKLKSNIAGKKLDQAWQVPGPVEIKKNTDGSYRLDYAMFSAVSARYQTFLDQPILKNIKLNVLEGSQEDYKCNPDREGALDLTTTIGEVYKLLTAIPGLQQ